MEYIKKKNLKGYGLAFMVEILCGILAGSNFGPNIRDWKKSGIANLVSIVLFKISLKIKFYY